MVMGLWESRLSAVMSLVARSERGFGVNSSSKTRPVGLALGVDPMRWSLDSLPVLWHLAGTARRARNLLRQFPSLDLILSRWDLPDSPEGTLLKAVQQARTGLPIITVLDEPFAVREPLVRCAGVTALLPPDAEPGMLHEVVRQIVGEPMPVRRERVWSIHVGGSTLHRSLSAYADACVAND